MKRYIVLLIDRKSARIFTLENGVHMRDEQIVGVEVPQKVKHGDNTWDPQDKIFRHIQNHLHQHLTKIFEHVVLYAKEGQFNGIIIGSHKPLFTIIMKHVPSLLSQKIKGTFVTELKAPFGDILKRASKCIESIESNVEEKRYENYLAQHS